MRNVLHSLIVTTWLSLSATSIGAQSALHDPTRPPDKTSLGRSVAPAIGTINEAVNNDESKPTPESIQMLVIGRQRKFALIDGVLVKPGESLNQWQLVSISRQSVVMRNAAVTQEISISPSVVKTVHTPNRQSSNHAPIVNQPSRNSP